MLVADCPRCGAKNMTFDVKQELFTTLQYSWQHWYELFCVCRHCRRSTTFVVSQKHSTDKFLSERGALVKLDGSLDPHVTIQRYISIRDKAAHQPPEHIPDDIRAGFTEAATCLAVSCWNAAGAMFRMCIDLATRPMLPNNETEGLNRRTRRDLGLRLKWLFENSLLPADLYELSRCIREDGNDGAHTGNLKKEDAEDLLDFTRALLERLYTEPAKLRLAEERRNARRQPKQ